MQTTAVRCGREARVVSGAEVAGDRAKGKTMIEKPARAVAETLACAC